MTEPASVGVERLRSHHGASESRFVAGSEVEAAGRRERGSIDQSKAGCSTSVVSDTVRQQTCQ